MDDYATQTQARMAKAATDLHREADALVTWLEGTPILEAESAAGDNARAAYEGARRWRSLVEEGHD